MSPKIFIIVPSFEISGPIKGAVALANMLSEKYEVNFVVLKNKEGLEDSLNVSVNRLCIYSKKWNLFNWIKRYKEILTNAGPKNKVISISMCFSADLVNFFSSNHSITISSIRANLIEDYKYSFGIKGYCFAFFHFFILSRLNILITMTDRMARQVKKFTKKESIVIGNFLDEEKINNFSISKERNTDHINLIFIGSLTNRKRPLLLIQPLSDLIDLGIKIHLTYIGDGPLKNQIIQNMTRKNLQQNISFIGLTKNPYKYIINSDIFILPSESEGISRAALECLYLGVPCILRDIDGNSELIQDNKNGFLFNKNVQIKEKIIDSINLIKKLDGSSLLPKKFTIEFVRDQYINLIDNLSLYND